MRLTENLHYVAVDALEFLKSDPSRAVRGTGLDHSVQHRVMEQEARLLG
jgi:hypothetical protein